jgi:hypothetical protein
MRDRAAEDFLGGQIPSKIHNDQRYHPQELFHRRRYHDDSEALRVKRNYKKRELPGDQSS